MREFKHSHLDVNEHLNKIELKEALKEEKMDTMRCDVSEMKNYCHQIVTSLAMILICSFR